MTPPLLHPSYIFGWTRSVVLVTLYADSLNAIIPALSSDAYKLVGLVMYVLTALVLALARSDLFQFNTHGFRPIATPFICLASWHSVHGPIDWCRPC